MSHWPLPMSQASQQGTLKRQSQFLVKYTKNDGNASHNSCKDLDEVHSFLAELGGSDETWGPERCAGRND